MCQLFPRDECSFKFPAHMWRCVALSLLSVFVLAAAAQVSAQEDDPDGLLVPPGLKKIADSPPPDGKPTDPSSPRTILGNDVETEVIGQIVSIDDRVLTLRDGEDQTRKFRVSKSARIQLDDEAGQLRDLRPGDTVRLKTEGDSDIALAVRAVSPPPSSDHEPDERLRQRRQAELRNEDDAQDQQRMQAERSPVGTPQTGGRVWMVMMDPAGGTAESGMRPGDVILIVDSKMVQSENVLNRFNLPSGLFPLQSNANGEVFIGPNGAGVGIVGPGGVLVPTGVNVSNGGFGFNGTNTNPNAFGPAGVPQAPINDGNFGPPIGGGPNSADRNFGPPIGTGTPSTPQVPAAPAPGASGTAPPAGGTAPGAGGRAPAAEGATN